MRNAIIIDTEAEADWIKAVTLARHGHLDTLQGLLARAERSTSLRHYGPGDHPNGSPQTIHGSGGGSTPLTIAKQGGDSLQPATGRRPTKGYMVAKPPSFGVIVTAEKWFDQGDEILTDFVDERIADFKADPDLFVGVWWDKAHAEFALDQSLNVFDLDEAIAKARAWDQQAIWDVENFEEIPTGGTGGRSATSGYQAAEGLGEDDPRGETRVGSYRGLRDPGQGWEDQEVAEALRAFHLRYDPNQPRDPAGTDTGGQWTRIGVHTGPRTELKDNAKGNAKLIAEATTFDALPAKEQERLRAALKALGITEAELDANIEAAYQRAVAEYGDPPPGLDWYEEAHDGALKVAEIGDLTLEQGAGMLAAASPQQGWPDNVASVEYTAMALKNDQEVQYDLLDRTQVTKTLVNGEKVTLSQLEWAIREARGGNFEGRSFDGNVADVPYLRGKRLSDLDAPTAAAIIKAHAQVGYQTPDGLKLTATWGDGTVKGVGWTCGIHHLSRAVRIARGETPDAVLGGHKVRSFYNNIVDPHSTSGDVTVDVHAFSVAMGRKWYSSSGPYGYFAGGKPTPKKLLKGAEVDPIYGKLGTPPGSATYGYKGLYSVFAGAYRRVAASHDMTAKQMQAIAWVQWRKEVGD